MKGGRVRVSEKYRRLSREELLGKAYALGVAFEAQHGSSEEFGVASLYDKASIRFDHPAHSANIAYDAGE